jgi:hypothetical protein
VLTAGVEAAAVGAAAASVYGAAIRAAGVPMKAASLGAAAAQPLKVANFAMGVVVCTFWGTVLAAILGRMALNPSRTFVRATVAMATASLIVPIGAAHTAGTTKAALIGVHFVAAAIVIPVLSRALQSRAGEPSNTQILGHARSH